MGHELCAEGPLCAPADPGLLISTLPCLWEEVDLQVHPWRPLTSRKPQMEMWRRSPSAHFLTCPTATASGLLPPLLVPLPPTPMLVNSPFKLSSVPLVQCATCPCQGPGEY